MALGNTFIIPIPDIAQAIIDYGSGALIKVYRATSQTGTFSHQSGLNATLVANTHAYTISDTSGLTTSWYKHSLSNLAATVESELSPAYPALNAPVVTKLTLVQRAAYLIGMYGLIPGEHTFPGASGTTTSSGSTTTAICSSYADTEYPDRQFKDWYLRMTSGTDSGQERRIASLDETTGTFTVSRAFTGTTGTSATFELWGGLTGSEWREMLNNALLDLWTPFRWPFAAVADQTQYPLPYWIESRKQVQALEQVSGTDIREHTLSGGTHYLVQVLEGGGTYLYLPNASTNITYELVGERHPAALVADTDTLVISEINQRTLVTGCAARAALRIGRVNDSEAFLKLADALESERQGYARKEGDAKRARSPRQAGMVAVGSGRRRSYTSNVSAYY